MEINIDLETAQLQTAALDGLTQAANRLRAAISKPCKAEPFAGGVAEVENAAVSLSKQLLLLQRNLGKLKAALSRAAAPIAAAFLPALNRGITAATRFVKSAGAVLAALFGGAAGTDALAESADNAAAAETTLTKTTTAAGKAVKRALAGFDELEILSFSGSGGSTTTTTTQAPVTLPAVTDTITPAAQAIADKLLALLAPLRAIDFSPAAAAFEKLRAVVEKLGGMILSSLEWAWYNILTPLAKWVIEAAVPASVEALRAAFAALIAALAPVAAGLQTLFTAAKPVFAFLGGAAVTALQGLQDCFTQLCRTLLEKSDTVRAGFTAAGEAITALWGKLEPALNQWMTVFSAAFSFLGNVISTWVGLLIDLFSGLATFLAGAFTGDWSRAWSGVTAIFSAASQAVSAQVSNLKAFLAAALPAIAEGATAAFSRLGSGIGGVFSGMVTTAKTAVNGVVGLVNGMLSAVTSGINAVIRALNGVSFSIPSWVPGLGGKSYGMNLSYVATPRIPYLAQGAVLPANKPFLAVVGDQKNGTNVEAPLATIQQAVADVLGAGQAEQAALLRQILQAVLGIEVGDTVIGQAAARYQRKMAVVTGGGL